MPDVSGIDLLRICQRMDPAMAVIMLTAYADIETVRHAFNLGARDFLQKPVAREFLLASIEGVLEKSRIARELRTLQRQVAGAASFATIVGSNGGLRKTVELAQTAATSNLVVLIHGETGTGKDLIAKAIHAASSDHGGPFVTAVIGVVPEQLEMSALFGHVKGAFTGADVAHRGFFEEADGGTLFLNEIGDISPKTQFALLRAIEDQTFRPVGAAKDRTVKVRVIAATNRNLEDEVRAGRFREDLYYRLRQLVLTMPALRDRREDIPQLVTHFAARAGATRRQASEISPKAMSHLCQYRWPGNVRELMHVIELAVVLADGKPVEIQHCHLGPDAEARSADLSELWTLPIQDAKNQFVTAYLGRLLQRHDGDVKLAAAQAGCHVQHLRRLVRELGIRDELSMKRTKSWR